MGKRKSFATMIDEQILDDFKKTCQKQGFKQNEVVEALMQGFIAEKIQIAKKVSYDIL